MNATLTINGLTGLTTSQNSTAPKPSNHCRHAARSLTTSQNSTAPKPDFENGYEIKTLESAKSVNTINGYLKNVKKKENVVAVVFDNYENATFDDDILREMLANRRKFRQGKIYMLSKKNELIRIN